MDDQIKEKKKKKKMGGGETGFVLFCFFLGFLLIKDLISDSDVQYVAAGLYSPVLEGSASPYSNVIKWP